MGANRSGRDSMPATIHDGHGQFDDHDAVQCADQKNGRHSDGHLEERKAEKPRHRQLRRRGVRERKHPWPDAHDALNEGGAGAVHEHTTSSACEI